MQQIELQGLKQQVKRLLNMISGYQDEMKNLKDKEQSYKILRRSVGEELCEQIISSALQIDRDDKFDEQKDRATTR